MPSLGLYFFAAVFVLIIVMLSVPSEGRPLQADQNIQSLIAKQL